MTMKKLLIAALSVLCALPAAAQAQAWPNKPIRWVIPYTPGGITDNVTRMIAQKLQEALGQPIVIENKPGANSRIAAEFVAKSPADGYTIITVIAAHAANATLYAGKLPFDPVKSYTPISLAVVAPLILTTNNSFPAKDVKELIAFAKANPGKVNFGSSGIGAAAHLTTELLKQTAGIDMVHVPFKGTAPALQALLSNDIQVLVDVPSTLMPQVRGGKIKALAMFAGKRVPGAQEVPTMTEAGGPGLESSTWLMFLAPAGTPRDIVNRLSQETDKAVKSADLSARFDQLGIFPGGGTPEQAAKFLNDEIARWAKVISTAGVKAED